MSRPNIKVASYRLDNHLLLLESKAEDAVWYRTIDMNSAVAKACSLLLKDSADLIALQNVVQKSIVKRELSPTYELVSCDHLIFAYNKSRLKYIEKRDVDLQSLVLAKVESDYGYRQSLLSSTISASLMPVRVVSCCFEVVEDASASGGRFCFVAVNCDLSGIPAWAHTYRCALITVMHQFIKNVRFKKAPEVRGTVILGSFGALPGSLSYEYLTRRTAVTEEKFIARVTGTEVYGTRVGEEEGVCLMECLCHFTVFQKCIGQLHHLTRLVIKTSSVLDSTGEWVLFSLDSDCKVTGTVEMERHELTIQFDPAFPLSGVHRHFRLSWVEKQKCDNSQQVVNLSSSCLENSVILYGLSYGLHEQKTADTSAKFCSAYATADHDQRHCSVGELLGLMESLKKTSVPLDFDLHENDANSDRKMDAARPMPGRVVPFTTWCSECPWSPFTISQYREPQFTAFFPWCSSPMPSAMPSTAAGGKEQLMFAFGTHDYIFYEAECFRCLSVRPLPSLNKLLLEGPGITEEEGTSSHLLLSCTLAVKNS
ncbi:hypothetical protein ERJ75_000824400 [Trypanosoma vivax]|nr:hypothetical protein ERJ75_000824400 [Trypanosoma vivax]